MSDDTKWLTEATEIANTVARSVHKRYAVYFEPADVVQELTVWLLRKEKRVKEWLDPNQEAPDLKSGIRQLAKALQREADKYCRTEKARAVGYETRDEYFYSIGVLEELITNLDELDQAQGLSQTKVSGGGGDPATGNNVAASVADVRRVMELIDPMDRMIIEMRYQEGLTFSQISTALGLSDSTIHRRINSALRRMVKELGGDSPWIGTRRVVSNAQAQAMLD